MKDDDVLPVSTPTSANILMPNKKDKDKHYSSSHFSSVFGRGRYKLWALAAILLLAFWSMLTGTISLRRSAGDLDHDDYHSPASSDDLDVLDLEEREKMVKHMWDVYTNSHRKIGLVGFWQEAFVAAYQDLTSDVPQVMEAAISEIARMSTHYINLNPQSIHSSSSSMSVQDLNPKQVVTRL